jgi:Pilus formation protein N terminal region
MALVFGRLILAIILAMGALAVIAPRQAPAADVTVILDQAKLLKLPDKTSTLVIGNPLIADASLQPGGMMVITGKGYGVTNMVALDRAGTVLMEKTVEVQGPRGNVVVVYRGIDRATYSCAPNCEARITLGDNPAYFEAVIGQTAARTGLAQGAAPAPK